MKLIDGKYIDKEEKDLIESLERGEWEEVKGEELKKRKAEYRRAVINTRKARKLVNQKVTINLFKSDIPIIQQKAEEEGLKYQTFIKQIIHKVATGKIKL